jgi:hypothetical protein
VHANLHGQEKVLTFLDSGGLLGGVLIGLRPVGAVTVGGSASTVLVLMEVREPEFILAVSNALVSSVAKFTIMQKRLRNYPRAFPQRDEQWYYEAACWGVGGWVARKLV